MQLCATHDLVVLDNAGSLWSAPEASVAWEEHALAARVPVVLRHHDPAWQRVQLRPVDGDVVPLHHPAHLHVLINSLTEREFRARWPSVHTRVVHNRVDVAGLAHGDRDGTRAALGAAPGDYLVVHPARVEGTSKNIPGAVDFVRRLSARRPDVRYWLTDDAPCPAADRLPGVLRGRVANQADLYAAADLVLLPSTWEGWGLPVCEAAAARKPVVAGPYPVLDEIRALGLTVFDPSDLDGLLAATDAVLDANFAAVQRHLDLRELPRVLEGLVEDAVRLSTGP
ncbi:glycosyltransferase family 4 protein [Lentzea chajnantorensis]